MLGYSECYKLAHNYTMVCNHFSFLQEYFFNTYYVLKVSKFQNDFMKSSFLLKYERNPYHFQFIFEVVIERTFGSAELFGQTSTVRFGPNDRTFFCRTQNFFLRITFNANGILSYFCFAYDPHVCGIIIGL